MTRLPAALLAAIAIASCTTRPPHPESFQFAATGDSPYNAIEAVAFDAMIAKLGGEPLAFVVHVGDVMAGGGTQCSDEMYEDRKRRLEASAHPLVLTPGDNDWTDCRRPSNGRKDPLERLQKVREVFFADAFSLGRARLPLAVQEGCVERGSGGCTCPSIPENRMWTKGKVVFATVHVVGSNDNRGFDKASDEEQRCRAAADARWIERAFRLAGAEGMRGLVLATQANPFVDSKDRVYDPLKALLAREAKRLGRPVLFVHGDTHTYRVDRPFRDEKGDRVPNLTRLEVYGSPQVGWVRVTVDPNDSDLFRFEPSLPGPG